MTHKSLLYIISFSFILALFGCIVKFDNLEYYKLGYSPNNDNFPTDGVYYKPSSLSYSDSIWPNAVEYLTFFKDGSFTFGSQVENIDIFLTKLQNPQEQLKNHTFLSGNYAPVLAVHFRPYSCLQSVPPQHDLYLRIHTSNEECWFLHPRDLR